MSKRKTKGKTDAKGQAAADGVAKAPALAGAPASEAAGADVAGDGQQPPVQPGAGGVGAEAGADLAGADALRGHPETAPGEGAADPAGAALPDDPTPVDLLIFAHNTTPQALVAAAYFAMDEALRLVCLLDGVQEPERVDFLGLFEHQAMAGEAHELIANHGDLPADSLWLHLTARGLMAKTAESFAELPGWQRHGFTLFIATYEALLKPVNAMIAERREALRLAAEQARPAGRVPLSETIFERHGHVSELMDGLRLNPRR